MKIYGAGSIEEIKKSAEMGAVGILTNPQGFEQYFEGKYTLPEITRMIVEATSLPVFIQIHAETTDGLVRKAEDLHAISARVGFKIIADEKGFRAIARLQQQGIRCIATTLFTLSQAAIAAAVGAFGICPFVSRAHAIGMNSYEILSSMKRGYSRVENAPEIIAVSLKNLTDVELALNAGVDAVGMRYPLIKQMMEHPLSQRAAVLFARNWAHVKGEDVGYLQQAMQAEGIAE